MARDMTMPKQLKVMDALALVSNIARLNLVNFSEEAYACYLELRHQKIRIGTQDLRIAAIVLAENSILVTRNQRDFAQVPGLVFEDWTIQN